MCDGYVAMRTLKRRSPSTSEPTTSSRRRWNALRSVISAFFITAAIWAGIADWPGCRVWELVLSGNAYWLWEMLFLFVAWDRLLWWTLRWEKRLGFRGGDREGAVTG